MGKGGLYTGFEGHDLPGHQARISALRQGIVAVDTNVLLNLYRYNDNTVDDLFKVLAAVQDRLFAPHQVITEFWRNRQAVIDGRQSAVKAVLEALAKNSRSSTAAIETWARATALPDDKRDALTRQVADFFTGLRDSFPAPNPTISHDNDPRLTRLADLLADRVRGPLPGDEWEAAVEEGRTRVANGQPPGFGDVDKLDSELPEGASGDYLVWYEMLAEGAEQGRDLVFVTSDVKADWWARTPLGKRIGPRPELAKEYFDRTGKRLHMLEPADLLALAADLGVDTDQQSAVEVAQVREAPEAVEATAPWTGDAVLAVLEKLDEQGYRQADVIRAAVAAGGRVTRDDVYRITGRDGEATLKRFTIPVRRLTADLQDAGVVPFGVAPLLRAVYDGGMTSSHFAVPAEVADLRVAV